MQRRARPRPARARRRRGRRPATASTAHRVERPRRAPRRARHRARLQRPELVEVGVDAGDVAVLGGDGAAQRRSSPRRASRPPTAPPTGSRRARRSRCAASSSALLGADRVLARASDLVRYASDASPYRLLPEGGGDGPRRRATSPRCSPTAARTGIPVVFRAGGTSLNGQGQTDGILVDVRRHFGGVAVEDDGAAARVKPGTVLGHANRVLAPHGRKLGPDPASTDIATVGGVIANNSGGMRCGTTSDSYSTVRALTFVLASGTAIDTAAPGRRRALRRGRARARRRPGGDPRRDPRRRRARRADPPQVRDQEHDRLPALRVPRRRRAAGDLPPPAGRLRGHARASSPRRSSRPCRCRRRTTTAWIHFPDIDAAIAPVRDLVAAGASAVELMVAPALIAAAWNMRGHARVLEGAPPESAALLVEFGGDDEAELDAHAPRPRRSSPATRRSGRATSPATRRRSSSPGGSARACTGWSAGCARRARR